MIEESNYSLKHLNTFGLDVSASMLVRISSQEQLPQLFKSDKFRTQRKMILGGGSNVLFTKNFIGLIIKLEVSGVEVIEEDDDYSIVGFGAGENWHGCVQWAIDHNLGGIENLSLIPGTIGAAPMQNIGAYGVEIKDIFHSLEAYEIGTGNFVTFYKEDCHFDYRYSVFKGEARDRYIITRVNLRLTKKNHAYNIEYGNLKQTLTDAGVEELSLANISRAIIEIRQSKLPDPNKIGNAGSFFKNPVIDSEFYESLKAAFEHIPGYAHSDSTTKVPAAWMIEYCGWKGKRFGDAGVHDKQSLVLVNHGKATGRELVQLSKKIQASVQSTFGISLQPEVNFI
ncbi:MAG: UDP-N-acetylmuramate dehydrogenase [Cyclobacteriaceae bacterium]